MVRASPRSRADGETAATMAKKPSRARWVATSAIRRTFSAIWSKWLPESGHKPADAPVLERYGPEFNPVNGTGGFEIWIPIEG